MKKCLFTQGSRGTQVVSVAKVVEELGGVPIYPVRRSVFHFIYSSYLSVGRVKRKNAKKRAAGGGDDEEDED